MKRFKEIAITLPALLFLVGFTAIPVLAEDNGSDSGVTTTHETTGTPEQEINSTDLGSKTEHKSTVRSEAPEGGETSDVNEIHTGGKAIIDELTRTEKHHTDAERHDICNKAEHGLETKLASLSKNATAFQLRVDNVLAKAIAYQKDKNITVTNFDALVASAQAAQAQAAASVAALNALSPNLDCTNANVATNVAEFKVAAEKARADLKTYKTAVRAIFTALEAAKGDTNA